MDHSKLACSLINRRAWIVGSTPTSSQSTTSNAQTPIAIADHFQRAPWKFQPRRDESSKVLRSTLSTRAAKLVEPIIESLPLRHVEGFQISTNTPPCESKVQTSSNPTFIRRNVDLLQSRCEPHEVEIFLASCHIMPRR